MKSQLMNIPVAPESKRAEVVTEARDVRDVSSMKIKGVWGGLWKDVGLSRRGGRWSHRVIHAGTLTIHWCGFSLVGLRHRRGGWIMTVFTARTNYRKQLGFMLHQFHLYKPLSSGVFFPSG